LGIPCWCTTNENRWRFDRAVIAKRVGPIASPLSLAGELRSKELRVIGASPVPDCAEYPEFASNHFYGTLAAVPHAAAIAELLSEGFPEAAPKNISAALSAGAQRMASYEHTPQALGLHRLTKPCRS
jgi:hypothetical protein